MNVCEQHRPGSMPGATGRHGLVRARYDLHFRVFPIHFNHRIESGGGVFGYPVHTRSGRFCVE